MKSRMKGDFHVRFRESLEVKLLGATRLAYNKKHETEDSHIDRCFTDNYFMPDKSNYNC